eukprot:2168008-Amphidinium_carterae.1
MPELPPVMVDETAPQQQFAGPSNPPLSQFQGEVADVLTQPLQPLSDHARQQAHVHRTISSLSQQWCKKEVGQGCGRWPEDHVNDGRYAPQPPATNVMPELTGNVAPQAQSRAHPQHALQM